MNLNDINEGIRKFKRRKRIGRGTGSGLGKTAGKGHKGQRSRAGHSQGVNFRGGSMPMFRLLPKRGFNNKFALKVGEVNVAELNEYFEAGDDINMQTIRENGFANYRYDVLKVLGDGDVTKALKVTAHRFSKSAREKIEAAGGECIVLPGKKPVVKNKMKQKTR